MPVTVSLLNGLSQFADITEVDLDFFGQVPYVFDPAGPLFGGPEIIASTDDQFTIRNTATGASAVISAEGLPAPLPNTVGSFDDMIAWLTAAGDARVTGINIAVLGEYVADIDFNEVQGPTVFELVTSWNEQSLLDLGPTINGVPYTPPGVTWVGSNDPDDYTGTALDDTLDGQGGNDSISGAGGSDTILGGDGNDTLKGGGGHDSLSGGNSSDRLVGGNGNDTLDGGSFRDGLFGGKGNDVLNGDGGMDTLEGGNGNDTLDGGSGNDTLKGGNGNDMITGGAGADFIKGGRGNDTIEAGGSDTVFAGNGNDSISVTEAGSTVEIHTGGGNDTVRTLAGENDIYDGSGNDYMISSTDDLGDTFIFQNGIAGGNDTVIAAGENDQIVLDGFGTLNLDANATWEDIRDAAADIGVFVNNQSGDWVLNYEGGTIEINDLFNSFDESDVWSVLTFT